MQGLACWSGMQLSWRAWVYLPFRWEKRRFTCYWNQTLSLHRLFLSRLSHPLLLLNTSWDLQAATKYWARGASEALLPFISPTSENWRKDPHWPLSKSGHSSSSLWTWLRRDFSCYWFSGDYVFQTPSPFQRCILTRLPMLTGATSSVGRNDARIRLPWRSECEGIYIYHIAIYIYILI